MIQKEKTMTRFLRFLTLCSFAALLGACAHPISLSGDLGKLAGSGTSKIDKGVGLNITDAERQLEVTTPGGGGDKVKYLPYRDLEAGVYLALSESFTKVAKVSGAADPKVAEQGLKYIVRPKITTTSSSPSAFTWPPTVFTVELVCEVLDLQGKQVAEVKANGEGRAEFSEFKGDFSLSAKRATEAALAQLVKAFSAVAASLR
jgi:hypothetical protein